MDSPVEKAAFLTLSRDQQDAIDLTLMAQVTARGGGAAVGVVQRGDLTFAHGYGLANIEWAAAATPETIFPIASISKPLTALAVMMLAEEGKLALDEPIDAYGLTIAAASAPITVAHLLTHTSGLRNFNDVVDMNERQRAISRVDLLPFLLALPCDFGPGARWNYSNSGYALLSYLVEKVAGLSFGQFMQARLFGPLGMTRTSLLHDRALLPGRASDYQSGPRGLERANYISFSWYRGAGAFASTVSDLARLEAGLACGQLLPPSLFARMLEPAPLSDAETYPYGLGWGVATYLGRAIHHHTGGLGGFRGEYLRVPDEGLAVVVLANNADFPFHTVTCAMTRILLGAAPVQRTEVATSAADRRAIAGRFVPADGAVLEIRDNDGRLTCTGASIAVLALDGEGNLYDVRDPEVTYALEREAAGDVSAVTLAVPMFAPQRFVRKTG